jgi:hypothetical protein
MEQSVTYWFVQSQDSNNTPEIVAHSQDDETKILYYKFTTHKKAKQFADAKKLLNSNIKYCIVKCIKTYDAETWF